MGSPQVKLTTADRAILREIRRHEPRPWPSARRLAERTGYTIRTVRRTTAKLRALGYEVETRWRPNGSQASNLYHLPQERIEVSRRRSYRKAASRARSEARVSPPRSARPKFKNLHPHYVRVARETRRRYGRRQHWRHLMGEVVPITDDGLPVESNATPGQALFAAIMDELAATGTTLTRRAISRSVKDGKAALADGVDPETVLTGCLLALKRGQPHLTDALINDVSLAKTGERLSRSEYELVIQVISRSNRPGVQRLREAAAKYDSQRTLARGGDS